MIVEKVIWTTLPAGVDDEKRLRVSVHVAPRLGTDDGDKKERQLEEFPAFTNWPERLTDISFEVQFDNGVTREGIVQSKPDPDLWEQLFPSATPVGPHEFKDHAKR